LQRLESLDLLNNRLTSLGSLELTSMHSLQYLNLQVLFCNELLGKVVIYIQVPDV